MRRATMPRWETVLGLAIGAAGGFVFMLGVGYFTPAIFNAIRERAER
jgi:hypothetical protein